MVARNDQESTERNTNLAHSAASPPDRHATPPLLRPGFAIRERLDLRVDATPVLALVAPAGWGKTQLMVHLYHRALRRGERVAWLSVPPTASRHELVRLLQAATFPEVDGAVTVAGFLRLLARRPMALFVDDAGPRGGPMEEIARALPQGSRLVLASRIDTGIAAERIGTAELAFTEAETRALLRVRLPTATGEQVGAIAALCDGWPVGFNLAEAAFAVGASEQRALARLGSDLSDTAEALLAPALDSAARALLAELSAVEDIEPSLAIALTGRQDIAASLAMIEATAMVRRDGATSPLRPARFARPLLARWRDAIPAARLRAIHRAAATWFEAHGRPLDVIRHAIAADEREQATQLLRQNLLYMVAGGDFDRANEWVDVIPRDEVLADETLRFSVALVHVAAGEPHRAEPYLDDKRRPQHLLLRTLVANFADDPDTGARLLDEIATAERLPMPLRSIHANLSRWIGYSRGDYSRTDTVSAEIATDPATRPELAYGNWFALFRQATRRLALGRGWQVVDLLERPLAEAERHLGRESFPATLLSVALAAALLQAGQRERAAAALADRAATRRHQLTVDPLALSMAVTARLAFAANDPTGCGDIIDRFRRIATERGLLRLEAQCIAEQVRLLGDRMALAALELAMATLLGLAEDAVPFATNGPWIRLPSLIGAAHAARALGLRDRALALLAQAEPLGAALAQEMDLAEIALLRAVLAPTSAVGTSPPTDGDDLDALAARLRLPLPLAWRGVPHVRRGTGADPITIVPRATALVQVTARERSVLRELGLAQSNKSIARALGLGQETVKWHIANLLGKLGARDRRELAQKAGELGLLDSATSPAPHAGEVHAPPPIP